MFWTDLLPIIRSLVTVFTVTGICHTGYVDCLLAAVNITSMTNIDCYEHNIKTPDDGQ